ncbi:ABC transporter substrate-binding protein [Phenylobacterium sp.]|uniref:ABC transporter substrate-binding protein n=1 Tax=Phenylobacterium sp. TaxID=1871053 RepID=UPI00120226A7|nr:ABC transporter substrate-binding protein [Phenylobacterium sp.]THD61569.1 MAG: ABC transporter substrate-binding protein [Phenylobacterium sp.]
MLRRDFSAGALSAGLSALAGCGKPAGKPALPALKVGSQKGGTKALMLASGVLQGAPYRVEWSEFPAAQPLLEAIGAGAVDLGAVGDAPFLFAFAGGGQLRAVHASRAAAGGAGTVVLVAETSPIRTVADLKGKRLATGRGSIGHYLVLALLDRAGLSPRDVNIAFLNPGDAKAAFSTGAIDAWSTWGSYVFLAQKTEHARILADGRGLLSGYNFEVANVASIADKRTQIADFLHRLSQAQRWQGANAAAYSAVLAKETGLDLGIAAQTVAAGRGEPVLLDKAVLAEERGVLERFQRAGAIAGRPDIVQAFDTSFAAAVKG